MSSELAVTGEAAEAIEWVRIQLRFSIDQRRRGRIHLFGRRPSDRVCQSKQLQDDGGSISTNSGI